MWTLPFWLSIFTPTMSKHPYPIPHTLYPKGAIMLLILIFAFAICNAQTSNSSTWYSIAKNKIFYSPDNGKTWGELNKGLPDKVFPIRLYSFKNKIYLATFSEGLFVLNKNDTAWKSLNSDLFLRRSSMDDRLYRKISAFTVSDKDDKHLFAATKHSVYESTDGGLKWKPFSTTLSSRPYITALHYSNNSLYLGTSQDGFYKISNNSAKDLSEGLPFEPYSKTKKFFEQISAIKLKSDSLYLGFYFGAGVFSSGKKIFDSFDTVDDIDFRDDKLVISSGGYLYSNQNGKITKDDSYKNISVNSETPDCLLIDNIFIQLKKPGISAKSRNAVSSSKKAIYTSSSYISENLNSIINQINNSELNSVVIDMKDDEGHVLFNSKNPTAIEIKSVKPNFDVSKILKTLKDNNIYAIARLVTFKDKMLFLGYSGKYAIKHIKDGSPWKGLPNEYWVDPHSEFVHNYNVSLAKELQDLGFDEIQFDYIRFPMDGGVSNCNYSFKKDKDTYKSEIITDFIRLAKKSLSVPVSVDIYGFNAWYYTGNLLGQDIEELSAYADVISPMVYPSHFGGLFYSKYPHNIRPYKIVLDGGIRSVALSDPSVSIRPYLQAFEMMSPTWGTEYILHQINGASESKNDGYLFWNAAGEEYKKNTGAGGGYKVLYDALKIKGL